MEPDRFDAFTRIFAGAVSRRRLLQGAAAGALAALRGHIPRTSAQPAACSAGLSPCDDGCFDLQSDRNHCGVCDHRCPTGNACSGGGCIRVVCDVDEIDCWGTPVDPKSDPRNCGQCGEVCAAGKPCVECACADPDLSGDACRSERMRLWLNAFLPGFLAGAVTMETVDGVRRAVVRLEWPEDDEDDSHAGEVLFLLADRDPDLRFPQTPFSIDIDAPAMGGFELDLTLPTMIHTTPLFQGGQVVQLQPDGTGGYTTLCQRLIKPPAASCFRLDPLPGAEKAFDVDCRWTVQLSDPPDPACPIDSWPIAPIRIQGRIEIERDDINGLVEVRFLGPGNPPANGRVSRFPAFEMYAALDDGNLVPLFQQEPGSSWIDSSLVEVEDELLQQCGPDECQGVVARLGCGCGTSCTAAQECFVNESGQQQCRWLDSYFVLSGSQTFDQSNDIVCADPRCPARSDCTDPCRFGYITADGPLSVTVDGRTIYTSDGYGKRVVPPIGFQAQYGSTVRISGLDTENTRNGLGQIYLHRVDGPHGLIASQDPPPGGNLVTLAGQQRIEAGIKVNLARSVRGSSICCRDQDQQVCVDRMSSNLHCGGCNRTCPEGMICIGGACDCPLPGIKVGDQCVDLTQNAQMCGPKLEDCTLDEQFCAQSSCVDANCRDVSNFQVCNGVCVARSDATACGPDCELCHVPQQGRAVCRQDGEARICDIECPDGFQRCGDECYEQQDARHCGPQCVDCGPTLNGVSACRPTVDDPSLFACAFDCLDGFHECSGQCLSNDSTMSCGFSCTPCESWQTVCVGGICCWEGGRICEGSCVDVSSDFSHCGDCGLPCNGDCCVGGVCYTMAQSCGSCGVVCGGGQICDTNGTCVDPVFPPDCLECETLEGGECRLLNGWTILGGVCTPALIEVTPIGGD